MSGEKKFGTSAFGFNKTDVNAYIEKILNEFDLRLKEKDDEISNLKLQIREMKARYETDSQNSQQLSKEKEKIASALIMAQETADSILSEARNRADEERIQLEQTLESERERIIDLKRDIKTMKSQVSDLLSKFQGSLNEYEIIMESKEEYNKADEVNDEEGT